MFRRKFPGRSTPGFAHGLIAATLIALALLLPTGATATVLRALTLDALIADADAIVLARVERSGARLVREGTGATPYTFTTLHVSKWLKGDGPARIVLKERGGQFGNHGLTIDGAPEYRAREEVLVFLSRRPNDTKYFRTSGMTQGKFTVLHGAPGVPDSVSRDTSSVALVRTDTTSAGHDLVASHNEPALELDNVLDRIREVLAKRGAQ